MALLVALPTPEQPEDHEPTKHVNEDTGYHYITCSCGGFTSKQEYFLGWARTEFWKHLDEVQEGTT